MRMKKLLTFLVLLTVSVGTWAADFTWTSSDGQYTLTATSIDAGYYDADGDGNNDSYTDVGIQFIEVNKAGALAAFVEETGSTSYQGGQLNGIGGNSARSSLKITGPMNEDDFSSMNSTEVARWGRFTIVDLKDVENATLADISKMNLSPVAGDTSLEGVKYLRLPNGMTSSEDVASMGTLKSEGNNSNLLVVGSTDNVATNREISQISMHSFQSNEVANFSEALLGGYNTIGSSGCAAKTCVRMAGLYGDMDLYKDDKNLFGGTVESFDFTNATFDPYTIESLTISAYPDGTHPYARGPLGDGTDANDPFADISQNERTAMVLTNYQTNALYFLSKYGENIKSIVFPTGNTDIPPTILKNASKLTEANIPSHYTLIGHEAFLNTGITQVSIGRNVRTIEAGAFSACTKLEDVNFETGITDQVYGPSVFSNCQKMKHIVFPEGVTTLGAEMFSLSAYVESVRLPESLLNIGSGCFMNCHSLTTITIPENVEKIGLEAFSLTPLRDVYLTCTDPEKLPLIWSMGNNFEDADLKSSFGGNALNNNTSTGTMTRAKAESMTWDDAALEYYFVNGIAVLHFPKQLAEAVRANITSQYNWKSTDNIGLPDRNNGDYAKRANTLDLYVGTNGTGLYTKNGWAQFALMKEYVPNSETVIYTKEYDDVWYTMCFPFDLTDEQLVGAFNEDFNILDFSAVEIRTDDNNQNKELVLHFNNVAKTVYKDQDGVVYTDLGKNGDYHTFQLTTDNGTETYTHVNNTELTQAKMPTYAKDGDSSNGVKYIDGYLALAGHPYMIHPNTGTSAGSPKVRCHFSGITWIPEENRDALYESQARTVDLGVPNTENNFNQAAYEGYAGQTYTFKGNWRAVREGSDVPEEPTAVADPGAEPTFSIPTQPTEPLTEPDAPPTNPEANTSGWENGYNNMLIYALNENWQYNNYMYHGGWTTYFNLTTPITESQFNDLISRARAYKDYLTAMENFDQAAYDRAYAAYLENQAAWDAWNTYSADPAGYEATWENTVHSPWQTQKAAYDEYLEDYADWQAESENYQVLIPQYAYFLARATGAKYPKYYRETAAEAGRTSGFWKQYTAIIEPNDAAKAGIEGISSSSAGTKSYNIAFNEDYEGEFDPTAIKDIIAKAEEKGEKVEYMNIVYSINGEIISKDSRSLGNLPQGMYIVNGKKYLVK